MLILIPVLNPKFDPEWKAHWGQLAPKALPFFFLLRTVCYAGAVASRLMERRIFGDNEYDFRARVGRFVYVLCVIWLITGLYFGVSALVYFILEAVGISTL